MALNKGNWFTRFFHLNKSLINAPATNAFLLGLEDYTKWAIDDYKKYASEGYIGSHVVYSCINKIATCAANIDILVYDITGEPKEVENEVSSFVNQPNPNKTWKDFCRDALSYLLIGGNCYIYTIKVRNMTRPTEMYLLRPDCVTHNKDGTFDYLSDEGSKTYQPEEITHIKLFNPTSELFGLSPIQIAGLSIDQNVGSKKWNARLLQNSARPIGAFAFKNELDDKTRIKLLAKYEERTAGKDNAGKPMFIEGDMTWVNMGLTAAEMEWEKGVKMTTVDITAIFGVPPELIGYPEFRTYNNVKEAKQTFYEDTVLIWLDFLLEQINKSILSSFGKYEAIYDPDKIKQLQENVDALHTRATTDYKNGLLSLNEARMIIGYDPIKSIEGDILYGSMGQIPIATTTGAALPDLVEEVPNEPLT